MRFWYSTKLTYLYSVLSVRKVLLFFRCVSFLWLNGLLYRRNLYRAAYRFYPPCERVLLCLGVCVSCTVYKRLSLSPSLSRIALCVSVCIDRYVSVCCVIFFSFVFIKYIVVSFCVRTLRCNARLAFILACGLISISFEAFSFRMHIGMIICTIFATALVHICMYSVYTPWWSTTTFAPIFEKNESNECYFNW